MKSFLAEIMDRELILHSFSTDLQLLFSACEVAPKNVFDTQIAANLLGIGNTIGLAKLIENQLDISLDKGQTLSDWTQRPLSQSQIDYALDDVKHLVEIAQDLQNKLKSSRRETWLQEEIASATQAEKLQPQVVERDLWKNVRRIAKLNVDSILGGQKINGSQGNLQGLRILQELAIWRDSAGQRLNLHPALLMKDDVMVSIAIAAVDC